MGKIFQRKNSTDTLELSFEMSKIVIPAITIIYCSYQAIHFYHEIVIWIDFFEAFRLLLAQKLYFAYNYNDIII